MGCLSVGSLYRARSLFFVQKPLFLRGFSAKASEKPIDAAGLFRALFLLTIEKPRCVTFRVKNARILRAHRPHNLNGCNSGY